MVAAASGEDDDADQDAFFMTMLDNVIDEVVKEAVNQQEQEQQTKTNTKSRLPRNKNGSSSPLLTAKPTKSGNLELEQHPLPL
eukprot:CAMPEP_0194440912 /NCGR_PEP_ID=MMETSP0176-20130528/118733_1 /TAXON_ID=216777 /ORGANISM="Proboscia alata, Strain PI-D3" /LENGTH=82 /DNA_ID=CAMNT_0039265699 /DNA_START=123 /DNA_END=367 /DNA_ORIENTATION=-